MDIYLRRPVNKVSSLVVNQCGCASEIQLNNLIEERNQLKANLSKWMKESSSSKALARKNKFFIKSGSAQAKELNIKLKPYDEWHRKFSAKTFDQAFLICAKEILPTEVFEAIKDQANSILV